MAKFSIQSFKSGINQTFDDSLIRHYEAQNALNCDISRGTLRTKATPALYKNLPARTLVGSYMNPSGEIYYASGNTIKNDSGVIVESGYSSDFFDYVNFYKGDNNVLVFTNGAEPVKYMEAGNTYNLLNRRLHFGEDGEPAGYYDANEVYHQSEMTINTFAPKGKFIELHYDRLWIGGIEGEPDRVYFSTADRNGADIQDFTVPISEEEANMHGGFIDFSSYDGGKVIGLKVVGDDIVVFKERTMFRIFGSDPSSYTKVQIFNSQGAIANRSIVVGGNYCFFLNHNNIYVYDGVNANPIGNRIYNILRRVNQNYVDKACGIYYDDKYYLAVPLDSSTENNCIIEYDTQSSSFMVYGLSAHSFLELNRKLYFSNSTGTYIFNTAGLDYLPLMWESPTIETDKNFRKIFDYFYASCTGKCKVSLITEKATKELIFDGTKLRKKLKNKGKTFKIKIESVTENGAVIPFELSTPEWIYEGDED